MEQYPVCTIIESRKTIYARIARYVSHLVSNSTRYVQTYSSKKRKLYHSIPFDTFYVEKYDIYVKHIVEDQNYVITGSDDGDTEKAITAKKRIEIYSKTDDLVQLFIDAEQFDIDPEPNTIILYEWRNHWYQLMKIRQRSLDTIYLSKGVLKGLIEEITEFLADEQSYHDYGIPYKKIVLLSGPPGTGKSSTLGCLASHFNYNVASVSFTMDLDDKGLKNSIAYIPARSFLIFEDIDSLFVGRDSTKNISFSGFLNVIDGLCKVNQLVIFMTTNHPDRLDPALMRPGRVDTHIKFGYATKNQVKQAFEKYRPQESEEDFKKFYAEIPDTPTTMCVYQKFFFKYRKFTGKIVEKIDDLHEYIADYHQQESRDRMPSHMVS